jgi:hypothetical protein
MSVAKKIKLECDRGTSMTVGLQYKQNAQPYPLFNATVVMAVKPEEWDESLDDSTAVILKRHWITAVQSATDLVTITSAVSGDVAFVEDEDGCRMFDGTLWHFYSTDNPMHGEFTVKLSHDDTLIPVDTYYYSIDIRMDSEIVIKVAKGQFAVHSNTVNVI